MRIFNYSSLNVDRPLWHWLAQQLRLNGQLRDAELIDRRELTVVIDRGKPRAPTDMEGTHGLGRISIYPCRVCNSGFVLVTFLHELLHAWLYLEREPAYFEDWSEEFCEHGALCLFCLLGGRNGKVLLKCKRYLAPTTNQWNHRRDTVQEVVQSLRSCTARDLKTFFRPTTDNTVMPREALALLRLDDRATKAFAGCTKADSGASK